MNQDTTPVTMTADSQTMKWLATAKPRSELLSILPMRGVGQQKWAWLFKVRSMVVNARWLDGKRAANGIVTTSLLYIRDKKVKKNLMLQFLTPSC